MRINVAAIGMGDETFKFDPNDRERVEEIVQMIGERLNQGFIVYAKIRGKWDKEQIQFSTDVRERLEEIEEFTISTKYVNKTLLQAPTGG